jgi:hypothetical protein
MGKLSQTMVIIGEGPTEYYYFNSLKDRFRGIQFEPKMPKHTSMRELQELLIKELNTHCFYEKRIEFFRKSKVLHSYFEKNNGSLDKAIANALRSCSDVEKGNRDYTFSQLGKLIHALSNLDNQK